jgi:hypothetical protein
MSERNSSTQGTTTREQVSRHLQATGQRLAGERGGRIANKISEAIGCGSVTRCDRTDCPNCAPTS